MPLACRAAFAICAGGGCTDCRKRVFRVRFGRKSIFFVIAATALIFYCVAMKQRVVFFLYPGIVSLDVSGPLEVFAAATDLLERSDRKGQGYTPVFAACTPGTVRTSSGLELMAEAALENITPDSLVVPGAPDAETAAKNSQILEQVRRAAARAGIRRVMHRA